MKEREKGRDGYFTLTTKRNTGNSTQKAFKIIKEYLRDGEAVS
jgi:hypothetical protein